MTPVIAILGLNLSSGLEAFVDASHDLGVDVVLVHEPIDLSGGLADLYRRRLALVDVALEVPRIDAVQVLAFLRALGRDVRGVYAGKDRYVEVAAKVAVVHELPGPGLRAAAISRNKLMQRLICRRHGVPVPAFTAALSAEEAHAFLARYAPVVAKPYDGSGSTGVRRLDSSEDLDVYLTADLPVLLEEYLTGREVSVECLVVHGKPVLTNVTHKGKGAEPYFVETLQVVPAELPDDQQDAHRTLAARIIELTGMETGILHLEAITDAASGTVYPVEWAVREPGHAIMDLINWRYSGRATPYLVGMYLDCLPPKPPVEDPLRVAATVFIELPPGTVRQVRQNHDPETVPGVMEFDFLAAAGDDVTAARDNFDTHGGYSVLAADVADLRRIADELDAAFGVRMRLGDGTETWVRATEPLRAMLDER